MSRLSDYLCLTRFNQPAGALLLLWPTLWGLWLAAQGWPGWKWLIVFVVGTFAMRAFGCTVNDIADRYLDVRVARTRKRPLAAGRINVVEATGVAFFFLFVVTVLFLQLPVISRWWALVGLALAVLYPLAKRVIPVPQIVLAVAFGMGIPIAYTAVRKEPPPPQAWFFMIGNGCWVLAYDTIYAMCDRDDDIKIGVNSSAVWLGQHDLVAVSLFYVATVLWLSFLGIWYLLGVAYQVALIAAMLLVFRFWRFYRTRQPTACLAAFRANHWFGAFVFAGVAAAFI